MRPIKPITNYHALVMLISSDHERLAFLFLKQCDCLRDKRSYRLQPPCLPIINTVCHANN